MKYLYFAYGSNLNVEQMKSRCPNSLGISPAVLNGWKLVERTYADIEKCPGNCVNGVLYRITEDDLAALDHYEGYPEYYTRQEVMVTDNSGRYRSALVYIMTDKYKDVRNDRPYPERYRAICSAGAAYYWGIPNAFEETPETGSTLWQNSIPAAEKGIKTMLDHLNSHAPLLRAKRLWNGARVVITMKKQNIPGDFGFYPAPLEVTTSHARELSWIFYDLRDILKNNLDSMNKFRFYGKLAENAVNVIKSDPKISARELCLKTVLKAEELYGEMSV